MRQLAVIVAIMAAICDAAFIDAAERNPSVSSAAPHASSYAGSSSCRECHEKFYRLWSTSRHGLAMQPFTPHFAKTQLTPQQKEIAINKYKYRVDIKEGLVAETGPKGKRKYKIEHVMGGKNVYYFLTPLMKGRLQTLPVAYDVNKKEWFDTAASGVRHFPGAAGEAAVNWKDSSYTFNTACYSCHVSQLSTNYDPKTDTYRTTWAEPGINCETCHGQSGEHNKRAKATPKGKPLSDPGIISTKTMSQEQRNDLCASCHAKGSPLTLQYPPGEKFFDHFDLVTLEDPDYYPDGRDLGENYTLTSWRMSPCVKSGRLDCMHCHTSSGLYRFATERHNDACMPCHPGQVNDPTAHTRHKYGSEGNKCVSCHMPMTSFARMNRSDHSMLPPTPAATIAYKSPHACTLCHKDKDAQWADRLVREWRTRDYQSPVLKRASLIDAARARDWSRLPDMLEYIRSDARDEVFTASLLRLLRASQDPRIMPVLRSAVKDPSPLVRAAAIENLSLRPSREALEALLDAAGDESRLVRVRAAAGLAAYRTAHLGEGLKNRVEKAHREYLDFIMARPDQWMSHYNMGNYQLSHGKLSHAVASYRKALAREPQAVMAWVNMSLAYAQSGDNSKAEESLRGALRVAPDSGAANYNMGLLKAEQKDVKQAEKYLKAALKADPHMAQAAHNLCILAGRDRLEEAVGYCRKACEIRPDDPKYAFSLAYYLNLKGSTDEALRILEELIERHPQYKDAQMLRDEIAAGKKPGS